MEKFWENIQQGNKKKLFYQAITGIVLIILAIGVYFMIKPRGHRAHPRPEIHKTSGRTAETVEADGEEAEGNSEYGKESERNSTITTSTATTIRK